MKRLITYRVKKTSIAVYLGSYFVGIFEDSTPYLDVITQIQKTIN